MSRRAVVLFLFCFFVVVVFVFFYLGQVHHKDHGVLFIDLSYFL